MRHILMYLDERDKFEKGYPVNSIHGYRPEHETGRNAPRAAPNRR
jgi:hypothetical protein